MIRKYTSKGTTYFMIDVKVRGPDGREVRIRKRLIPTKEQAQALLAKARAEAFEGRHFNVTKPATLTVDEALKHFLEKSKRELDSWKSDRSRAKHLRDHLAPERVAGLTLATVDQYRTLRVAEPTRRGKPPSAQTLDHELMLLKRAINYAVACGRCPSNPIADVPLLREPNTRDVTLTEADLESLLAVADEPLRTVLLIAYDTGQRKQEVLGLQWKQVDLKAGCIRLTAAQTKAEQARTVYLTDRTLEAIRALPRVLRCPWLFAHKNGKRWHDVRSQWEKAREQAGLEDAWFHDSRRSYATNARRRGIPESVVMRAGGWRTNSTFRRYNIVEEADLRDAARTLEAGRKAEIEGQSRGKVGPGTETAAPRSSGKRRNH